MMMDRRIDDVRPVQGLEWEQGEDAGGAERRAGPVVAGNLATQQALEVRNLTLDYAAMAFHGEGLLDAAYVAGKIRNMKSLPIDISGIVAATPALPAEEVQQFRTMGCADWYDGRPDESDGGGPYETRTLYTLPAPALPVVPEGWKLVPVKQTIAMEEAFADHLEGACGSFFEWDRGGDEAYAAMLSAAPELPEGNQQPKPSCETCNDLGVVGGPVGQTAESFDYVTEDCPDCPSLAASTEPVAYLHQVVAGDGEPDQALSFAPDNFPLSGALGYRPVSHQPLFTHPATQAAQPSEQDAVRLDALTGNVKWELAIDNASEDLEWCVWNVVGSRNDQEWREIGRGATPRAAIDAAILANQGERGEKV